MTSKVNLNILIGCTGSVASIKVPKIAAELTNLGHNIIIVPTFNALHFLKSEAVATGRTYNQQQSSGLCCSCIANQKIHSSENQSNDVINTCLECETKSLYQEFNFASDNEEWQQWKKRGDPVKHIELREWADILLLAPLDANTLAKVAQGLCDNLLTCIVRAWNMSKPIIFCPAMNTQMYLHPFTSQHINILKELGFNEVEVTSKTLICGEKGVGAMAEVDVIVDKVQEFVLKDI